MEINKYITENTKETKEQLDFQKTKITKEKPLTRQKTLKFHPKCLNKNL